MVLLHICDQRLSSLMTVVARLDVSICGCCLHKTGIRYNLLRSIAYSPLLIINDIPLRLFTRYLSCVCWTKFLYNYIRDFFHLSANARTYQPVPSTTTDQHRDDMSMSIPNRKTSMRERRFEQTARAHTNKPYK